MPGTQEDAESSLLYIYFEDQPGQNQAPSVDGVWAVFMKASFYEFVEVRSNKLTWSDPNTRNWHSTLLIEKIGAKWAVNHEWSEIDDGSQTV
jgi:hypothetical protein